MYLNDQILPLLAAIKAIGNSADAAGCSDDLTVASKSAIENAVALAKALESGERKLVIGLHEFKNGEGFYPFAVAPGVSFDQQAFHDYLGETFEPDREEFANVHAFPEKELIAIDEEAEAR